MKLFCILADTELQFVFDSVFDLDAIAQSMRPYRKPKRIRTAFSPSQLLRLESAFEVNHYVVGQERKRLAESLALTETQVSTVTTGRRLGGRTQR